MTEKQNQRAGDNSTNVQAGVLNVGASYLEVREMVTDLFRANFITLAGKAAEEAERRARAVTEEFLRELQKKNVDAIENAKQPDMQRALFGVQEAAACHEDPDLESVLVDMLVDRTQSTGRSLKQVVLNEALVTAPKLTNQQLTTLAIIFYCKRVVHVPQIVGSPLPVELIRTSIQQNLDFRVDEFATGTDELRHLEYAGCVSISLGEISAADLWLSKYPSHFFRGMPLDAVPEDLRVAFWSGGPGTLLVPRVDFADVSQLPAVGLEPERSGELQALVSGNRMSGQEVLDSLCDPGSPLSVVMRYWDATGLKSCELTSVGLAIGHARLRRLKAFGASLDVFLGRS